MKADEVKARVARYWRYDKQCPMVAFEAEIGGELADVLVVDKQGLVIETEVKVDVADLRADLKKAKHLLFYRGFFGEEPPDWKIARLIGWRDHLRRERIYRHQMDGNRIHLFYFAVPSDILVKAKEIIEDRYPWAGLLGVYDFIVTVDRKAKPFHTPKMSGLQLARMARDMSATLVRLAEKGYEHS